MQTTNIDRTDSQLNTKAPFRFECPLKLGYMTLPPCSFLSVRLYITPDMSVPARIAGMQSTEDGKATDVEFTDAGGRFIGTWRVYADTDRTAEYVSGIVYDRYGVIAGHVTVQPMVPNLLHSACRAVGGSLRTDDGDFRLLPQCCSPRWKGSAKAFALDGTATTANLKLTTSQRVICRRDGNRIILEPVGEYPYPVAVMPGDKVQIGNDLITVLRVGGTEYDVRGRHLIIKAGVTSNLRVRGSDGIEFSGVLDE